MRLIVMLLMWSLAIAAQAGEDKERERLRADLPRMARDLAESSERMTAALQRLGLKPPAVVLATIDARRVAAQEMQRLAADAAQPLSYGQIEKFRDESQDLRSKLGELGSLAETVQSTLRQWPHCVGTPELTRFQAFIRARLDALLTGDPKAREDGNAIWRLRHRHEVVLGVMEARRASGERWRRVPADALVLRQYLEQGQALQALAENGLEQKDWSDDRELERNGSILSLMAERVSLVQSREERKAEKDMPDGLPSMIAVNACLLAEDEVLQAMIEHRREVPKEQAVWRQQEDELRQRRELCGRMTGIAWDWLGMAAQALEQQRRLDDRLQEVPLAIRDELTAAHTKLDKERSAAERSLAAALAARVRVDAVRAKGELWVVLRGYEQMQEDLVLRLRLAAQEREFRAQASTATAALKQLATARVAYLAARDRQRELEQEAIRARVARDLAELASEEAQRAVEHGRAAVGNLRDELDRVRETVEAAQKQAPAATQADPNPGF